MKKKLISGLFLMLWMALLIAAMVYPQGIFPVLAASGVWVACLLTWAVIPVALAALIKNGPLWQELRASLLKTITRKENVFISWVMRLLIVVSLAWTGWAITLVFYLLTVSRIARREYGSLLSALIDQPQNPALRLQVMSAVYVALSRWEPRLTLDSITINSNFDGSMVVELTGRRNNGVPVSLSVSTGAENGSD